jgi:hypothetical protein
MTFPLGFHFTPFLQIPIKATIGAYPPYDWLTAHLNIVNISDINSNTLPRKLLFVHEITRRHMPVDSTL